MLDGLDTPVGEGDVLVILPAMAGGDADPQGSASRSGSTKPARAAGLNSRSRL